MSSLFKEKQRFLKPWLKLLLLIISVSILIELVMRFNVEKSAKNGLTPDFSLLLVSLLVCLLLLLVIISKLTLFINQYGIFINFFPFIKKHIVWYNIKQAKFIDCNSISGLGFNKFTKYGTAFKIKGNEGLHITLKNNKEFLIATRRPKKLKQVVETYRSVHNFK